MTREVDKLLVRMVRYEVALRRIAEADEMGHPLVKIALEALNHSDLPEHVQ